MTGRASQGPPSATAEMLRMRRSLHSASIPRFRKVFFTLVIVLFLLAYHNGYFSPSIHEITLQGDDRRLLAKDSDIVDKQAIAAVLRPNRLSPPATEASTEPVAAVLVFCATRPQAIRNHLEQLVKFRGSAARFPIIVSQDGASYGVEDAIKQFATNDSRIYHIKHDQPTPTARLTKADKNYFYIAAHYKWALDYAFNKLNFSHVIVTEDDLDIAEDFFSYFSSLKPLLSQDPSLWCISAWNDNGGKEITDRSDAAKLWRTDFFPGLGWMLRAETWAELRGHWPEKYWDDWMRSPEVRGNRSCIRPEISRTAHNMKLAGKGSSGGLYKNYLSSITLPDRPVDFSLIHLDNVVKNKWDAQLAAWLRDSLLVKEVPETPDTQHSYKIAYADARQWRVIADRFKLMNDIRSGMVRTAYLGIVPIFYKGARIYAMPSGLDESKLAAGTLEAPYDKKWDLQSKFMDFEKMYCKPSRYTGKCDPKSPDMRKWFESRNMLRKLEQWGEMIVV